MARKLSGVDRSATSNGVVPDVTAFGLSLDTESMEAKSVDRIPSGDGWQFEPKWDGFRCLAFKSKGNVDLRARSGKPLTRYFPEMVAALSSAEADDFVLDGELAVPIGNTLNFAALQDRLHPAETRVRKLAATTPALLILFDCLFTRMDGSLLSAPLVKRRSALENLVAGRSRKHRMRLTPFTRDAAEAQRWLDVTHGSLDGVVAKRLDGAYDSGKRAMLKIKRLRTADCVVGGFRYAKGSRQVGSLLLGLYNEEGKLDKCWLHVSHSTQIGLL